MVPESGHERRRHVEPGAEHLDELALGLLCRLCGDDDRKWHDALVVAQATLEARITLWDGVTTELDRKLN